MTRWIMAAAVSLTIAAPAWAAGQNDVQLLRAVERVVLQHPKFSIFDIVSAEVEGGRVTLTGKVTMPDKRVEIAGGVAAVRGVREIQNRIEVLPASPFDDELRFKIARAIYGNSAFWTYASMANPPIHIIVDRGRVTLEGIVNSEVDRTLAYSIAGSFDAFSVTNNLRTGAETRAISLGDGSWDSEGSLDRGRGVPPTRSAGRT